MKFWSSAIVLWYVCGLLVIGLTNSYLPEAEFHVERESQVAYKYDRMDEVQRQCSSVLSAASDLKADYSEINRMKGELSFINGDWRQDLGKFPIMPFDAGKGNLSTDPPVNLVSFWLSDVGRAHRLKKAIGINGFLVMGITRYGGFGKDAFDEEPSFRLWPTHSQLKIPFQGIYTESKKNGGERVLCLLGSAMLPTRESNPANPWEWMKNIGQNYDEMPLSEDDQILLVLHYPMTFTLTKRIISGELRSLNRESNMKYFDLIHIYSQMVKTGTYTFGSQNIVSKACNPYPYKDNLTDGGISIYKGSGFCEILEEITHAQPFYVVPNWKCKGTDDFCSKLGPFVSDKEIKSTDGSFRDVRLYMQNLICEQHGNAGSARVSTVFRAVSPSESWETAVERSGPNNMSLAAEGIWKPSSGQLCMVGCLGIIGAKGSSCNSRICLYIPTSFSIQQRSIIFGSLSPINNSSAFFPLSFEQLVQPADLWNYFKLSNPYYRYSKIDLAGALLEKDEPFSFGTVIKKSLLTFPKLEESEAFQESLSHLSEDLTLHIHGFPDPMPNMQAPRVNIQMEILSVGPLFGRYWFNHNVSTLEEESPYHVQAQYTEKQLLVNVSAQLSLNGNAHNNFSELFLEGLYDQHVGKMYLIGCRDVRASWQVISESGDLEAGLDCLIRVVVAYPPTTARWLANPTAKISIESQRSEDDPLHFSTINLQTFPIMYSKQREDILSRMGIEGILRFLTLSLAIGCISSQLFYINHNVDSLPYISLVMLGVQAIGYSIPLITDAEALFKRMSSDSYDASSFDLENKQRFHVIDYSVKLLLIVSLLLTLRLCQKVWKSRVRLLKRSPLEPHLVPSDKWVFLSTFTIHLIGYIIVLIIHGTNTNRNSFRAKMYGIDGENSWITELEEYMGLVQDFYLLPQILGNFLWQIDHKPLRKFYFIGITVVRLLPHIYDYIRAPFPITYVSEDSEFVNRNFNFYSKFVDVAIPVTAIILASVVYIQQRWSYEKLSETLKFGQQRLLPRFRYQRLPSQSVEAELVPHANGTAAEEKEHFDLE